MHLPTLVRFRLITEMADQFGGHYPAYLDGDCLQLHAPDTGDSVKDFDVLLDMCKPVAKSLCDWFGPGTRVAVWMDGRKDAIWFETNWEPMVERVERTIPGHFKRDGLAAHLIETATLMAKAAR